MKVRRSAKRGKMQIELDKYEAEEVLSDIENAVGIPRGYATGNTLQRLGLHMMEQGVIGEPKDYDSIISQLEEQLKNFEQSSTDDQVLIQQMDQSIIELKADLDKLEAMVKRVMDDLAPDLMYYCQENLKEMGRL